MEKDTTPVKTVKKPKRVCKRCGGGLRKIGVERVNGKRIPNKTGKDWDTREYHKKCYKFIQQGYFNKYNETI